MTMKYFFLFGFIFFLQSFYGQVDGKYLKKMSYDELKMAFFKNEGNLLSQKQYANEYINRSKKENDETNLVRGYYFYSLTEKDLTISIKYLDSITEKMKPSKEDTSFPILAFYQKGILYGKLYNYELAIENFLIVEKISQEYNNLEYYYDSKYAIGKLKSENLGEVEEGLSLYKECLNYYKTKDTRSNNYFSDAYQRTIFAIADSYKSLNQLDSASYYNKLGFNESKKTNNNRLHYLFVLNEGANQILKKNYYATIDSVDIALPKLKGITNIGNNILASYYYYGKAYEGLKNYKMAIKNYSLVDSIYQGTKIITPEFTDGYRFLINYYSKNGNKEKQLYYINTLMSIDSLFQKNYRALTKKIQKDYDIPHLMKEKETIISELKNGKTVNYYVIITLFVMVLFALLFGVRQNHLKKTYKERFENLVNTKDINYEEEVLKHESKISTNEEIGVADEIVEMILKELKSFEKNKSYLNSTINIQNLAQEFNTNSKYLSIIINTKKEKSFTQYINDLRIDNIVNELKTNKSLRKYTMAAIAEEAGFNTAESFSKAFFKKTGLKPSYFVKELQELK